MAILQRKHIFLVVLTTLALLLSLLGLTGCPTNGQTYTLTVNVSPSGGGSVSPPGGEYDPGTTVTLTATPNSGYTFDYWSGSTSGTSPTTTVVMDLDKSVTAHFKATTTSEKFTLTVNVSPSGGGSVSPPGGEYDPGTTVTLTAIPNSGYTFDYWSGSTSGPSPTTNIVMDLDKSVTAHFVAAGPTVLFSDDFSQDTSVWDIFSDADGRVFYENGWLHVINDTDAFCATYSMAHQYFDDFILEVETKLVDGTDDNWHQVAVREQNEDNYYSLDISADGYYEIFKVVNGNQIVLTVPTYSSYINQGVSAVNLIHIECIGSSLSLSVNGHTLISITDTTFSAGDIGLAASSLAGTFSEIAFDNIVVTEP